MPFQKNVFIHFECEAFLTIVEYERLEAAMWRPCFFGSKLRRLQAETLVRSLLHGIELIKFFKKKENIRYKAD